MTSASVRLEGAEGVWNVLRLPKGLSWAASAVNVAQLRVAGDGPRRPPPAAAGSRRLAAGAFKPPLLEARASLAPLHTARPRAPALMRPSRQGSVSAFGVGRASAYGSPRQAEPTHEGEGRCECCRSPRIGPEST